MSDATYALGGHTSTLGGISPYIYYNNLQKGNLIAKGTPPGVGFPLIRVTGVCVCVCVPFQIL